MLVKICKDISERECRHALGPPLPGLNIFGMILSTGLLPVLTWDALRASLTINPSTHQPSFEFRHRVC